MDSYDQREVLAQQKLNISHPSGRSYRMLQAAMGRAAFGNYVLVIVQNRESVNDLGCLIPDYLSRNITVRCIESHPDIDWSTWKVPGWDNYELFVDQAVIEKKFPRLVSMLKY